MVHFETGEEKSSVYETQGRTLIAFLAGAAIGSLITYFSVKQYYRDLANKEIDEVTQRFVEADNTPPPVIKPEPPKQETRIVVDDHPKEDASSEDIPHIISLSEFVEDEDYDKETLIYYSDGVLADQFDHQLSVKDIIMDDELLDHFGEEEANILYIRNEYLKTDYEIEKDSAPSPDTVMMEGDLDDD